MASTQPLRTDHSGSAYADLAHYWREGYTIVRGFFDADEVAEISAVLDQLHAEGVRHGRCFRHGNLFYNVARESEGSEPLVRMVQWPSYHQPVLNRIRLDFRFAELLGPLIGSNLKQIINQVHWKAPGALGDFAWLLLDQARILEGEKLPDPASFARRLSAVLARGLAA